jgi:uncharacterized repeat protein (TIGR01451 family)
MKSLIILGLLLAFPLYGQQSGTELTMTSNQLAVSFSTQAHSGAIILPLIEAKFLSGKKEQYGIIFHSNQSKAAFVEILDENGKVVKSISVDEFVGKKSSQGVTIVKNIVTGSGRVAESDLEIKTASGTVHLYSDALLVGTKNNSADPEYIVETFSLSSEPARKLAVRLNLAVEGNADVKKDGIVLSGKLSASAVAVSVLPTGSMIASSKNNVTITTPAAEVSGKTSVLWLTVAGESAASLASAKSSSAAKIVAAGKNSADAKLVIVNTISKSDAQPGDTVTYSVVCKNIGIGSASNISLSNPVPNGTLYLNGSASEDGATVNFEKDQNGSDAVKKITWGLLEPLSGGTQKSVHFKVIIQ